MLSKTERKYLQGTTDDISGNHRRFIKFKIKNKLRDFYMLELPLIQSAGVSEFNNIIMEFNNGITENSNAEIVNPLNYECGRRDLNPGNGLGRPVY